SAIALAVLALLAGGPASPPAAAQQTYTPFLDETFSASGQQLDLYVPAGPPLRTALVFIHGGGFVDVTNQKESLSGYAQLYAQGGFVSATINYRLAPEHVFPAALDDVQAAVRWLRKHGRAYGYPAPRRIVVIGYSAGGNLALMAGLADRSGIAGIVSGAGPSDLRALVADTPFEQLKEAIASYLGGQNPDAASPLFRVSRGDPRVLLFQGDSDVLVPLGQAQVLADKLKRYRVPVTLRVFPGAGHEIMGPSPYLGQLLTEMTQFLLAIERGHGRPAAAD
ncbi:MAG TPA: alpha/beta hydrolase, partial [Thermoanaerobaculia bacterium]|nr:alpha/beta hydrolase [Thermoanaerobaculia bacterium]